MLKCPKSGGLRRFYPASGGSWFLQKNKFGALCLPLTQRVQKVSLWTSPTIGSQGPDRTKTDFLRNLAHTQAIFWHGSFRYASIRVYSMRNMPVRFSNSRPQYSFSISRYSTRCDLLYNRRVSKSSTILISVRFGRRRVTTIVGLLIEIRSSL